MNRICTLALVLALFWGFNFVVVTAALGDVPPLLLAAVRFSLAALLATGIAFRAGRNRSQRSAGFRNPRAPARR